MPLPLPLLLLLVPLPLLLPLPLPLIRCESELTLVKRYSADERAVLVTAAREAHQAHQASQDHPTPAFIQASLLARIQSLFLSLAPLITRLRW